MISLEMGFLTLVSLIIVQDGINVQVLNKKVYLHVFYLVYVVQDGNFQKIDKICRTIIRETKVVI